MPDTVLVLAPHPGDAEYYAGGALARWVSEGAKVFIVVATDGRCGSYMEESEALAGLRADELLRGARILGAQPPVVLGYRDTELDGLPPGTLREQFVAAIRQLRPDVAVARDPYALFESHPDRRSVAWAAYEAVAWSHLPLIFPHHINEGLEPHLVSEKLYYGETLPGANRIIDTSSSIDRKLAVLAEHRTQAVFFVEGRLRQAALAGLDLPAALAGVGESPAQLLNWAVKQRDAAVGQRAGYAYGEAFRYERYDPVVEAMLARAARQAA